MYVVFVLRFGLSLTYKNVSIIITLVGQFKFKLILFHKIVIIFMNVIKISKIGLYI